MGGGVRMPNVEENIFCGHSTNLLVKTAAFRPGVNDLNRFRMLIYAQYVPKPLMHYCIPGSFNGSISKSPLFNLIVLQLQKKLNVFI